MNKSETLHATRFDDVTHAKIRASIRILTLLSVGFGIAAILSWHQSAHHVAVHLLVLGIISSYHLVFHIWCQVGHDQLRRHSFHIYLVIISDLIIAFMSACSIYPFFKMLGVVVVPVSFGREVRAPQDFPIFVVFLCLHFLIVAYSMKENIYGEGGQWLMCLMIMNILTVDAVRLQILCQEQGVRIAQYSEWMSDHFEHTTKGVLQALVDAVVVLQPDMSILEPSSQLAAMLGRSNQLVGQPFGALVAADSLSRTHSFLQDQIGLLGVGHSNDVNDQSLSASVPAGVLDGVKLMDSYGQDVTVNMFCVTSQAKNGTPLHIVGISEFWKPPKDRRDSKKHKFLVKNGCTMAGESRNPATHSLKKSLDEPAIFQTSLAKLKGLGTGWKPNLD